MKRLIEALKIPRFPSYEVFLGSSWLAIRVATAIVFIMAFQSKKVIEEFSLYDGIVLTMHSFAVTIVFALAVLSFTVKLSHMGRNHGSRKQIQWLILFFATIELILGLSYHVIWWNVEEGTSAFQLPPLTDPRFWIPAMVDFAMPAALYFYGHTIGIKNKREEEMENPPPVPVPEIDLTGYVQEGDTLLMGTNVGDRKVQIKGIEKQNEES